MLPDAKSPSPRKRIKLLLLDANVVIELHVLGLWDQIVDHCEVLLGSAVLGEAEYFEDSAGRQKKIDLAAAAASGRIQVVATPILTIEQFRKRFQPTFLERLDPGELEALAYLCEIERKCVIASADKIVWRTLGALGLGEQGMSLEEVLERIGRKTRLPREHCREYREEWTRKGFAEGLRGEALQAPPPKK